ncbi:MAG TPA: helix-turn-helix domain-containing protein [Acidimicrobiales bacterium]|nr:helix-turn-helix domain-containing protein [Acidimicrobiales bacterium]
MSSAPELRLVDADAPAPSTEAEGRILDAALVLVARWGVAKTALGDIAKEAGCSRATLYRAFPGGKQHLFLALATRELATYRRGILDAIDAADELGDALTRALVVASRLLHDHDAAQFILEHEPELLLPFLGFHQVDLLYRETATAFGPHLERFLPDHEADRAAWAAEWAARLFITYLFNPHERRDLAVIDDARTLIDTYVLPAFAPVAPASPRTT